MLTTTVWKVGVLGMVIMADVVPGLAEPVALFREETFLLMDNIYFPKKR